MFLDIPSRFETSMTFWDKYGTIITFALPIIAIIALFIILWVLGHREEQRKQNETELNGKIVDERQIITVTLVNYETISCLKGERFIAPLPERDGYDFAGWFYDASFTKPYINRKIRNDLLLYPRWIKSS